MQVWPDLEVSDAQTHQQLQQIIDLLTKLVGAVSVTFSLSGGDMATQTGNTFTIPDTSPVSPFTLVAEPQDSMGNDATVTSPAYDSKNTDPTIIANFASADGLTATFNLPTPPKVGSTAVKWSGTSANSTVIAATVTFTVASGAAVSVTFTLTTP